MKKSRLIALLSALMIVAAMAFVVGCGSDDDNGDSSSDTTAASSDFSSELISPGKLLVGSDIPYPPFEFGQGPNYKGFDIDVINAIAERLDLQTDIQATKFDTIFVDLQQGKFDAVISASTITPEREKTVNFSAPYYNAEQALVVPPGSDISSVEDLAGKTVAAQNGTTGKDFAENETDASSVNGFDLGPDVTNAVKGGQVDAGILDMPVARYAIKQGDTGFEVAAAIPTGELYGIAVSKDNPALLEAINNALAEMKEDGTLDEVNQKWFGIDADASVIESDASGDAEGSEG